MQTSKTLLSIGAAIAGTKLAQMFTHFDVDHALGGFGLSRRRNHVAENLAFLGVGVVVGGVAALLLAPANGEETRHKISQKVNDLGDAAQRRLREVREEVNGISGRLGHENTAERS